MVTQIKSPQNYEQQTQEIARKLLEMSREKRSFLGGMGWEDKLLGWAMSNPNLRVQLFRFIDALPALQSKKEIARHLQQYLGDKSVELPGALKGVLNFTDANSAPAQLAAATITKSVESLAYKYIAGENIKEVINLMLKFILAY